MAEKPSYEELERRVRQLEQESAEHDQAKLALLESEAKYRAIVESFDGLIYVCSQDYRVEFMNERFIERTGYNAVGEFCYMALHGRDAICPWCVNERVFQGETVRWEVQSPKDNRWYYTVNTLIRRADGRLSKQAMILDITDRKRMEELLDGEREILAMVATGRSLKETLDALSLMIERLAPGTLCSILLADKTEKRLFHQSAPSLPREFVKTIDALALGLNTLCCGSIARNGYTVIAEDAANAALRADARDSATRFGLGECWSMPIQDNTGKTLGVFALYDRESRQPSFADIELVERAAYLAGLVIERDRSERATRESEEKYHSLFEHTADAICFTTREGRFVDVNQSAVDLFRYEKSEMLNLITVADIYVNPEDRVRFQQEIEKQGFVKNFEVTYRRKDGQEMECLLTSSVRLADDGTVMGYQSIIRDITEVKRAEIALQQSAEKTKLFAYSVSHDLKSPAIGIYGLSKLLHRQYRDVLDEKARSYCDQILKTAEQIAALVEQINLYIATKQVPLSIETVETQEILQTLKDEFSLRLKARKIGWVQPEKVPAIRADRLGLLRFLRNLVDNSLKYGGDDLSEIRIGYRESDKHHILIVSDNGVGIRMAYSKRIFERFERDTNARGVEGTGLGLAIVKEIAEQHRGKVWVEPKAEKGTVFCVSIAKDL